MRHRHLAKISSIVFVLALAGCGSNRNAPPPTTKMEGNWSISITPAAALGLDSAAVEVTLVPYVCTVPVSVPSATAPTLSGPSCFAADSFANVGSISGVGINPPQNGAGRGSPQSVLLGVSSDPASGGSTVGFVYVEWYGLPNAVGDVIIIAGTGTVNNGTMAGTWTATNNCGSTSSPCTGAFTGSYQP